MPGFVNVLGTVWGAWDQPDKNRCAHFRYAADIFWNITNPEVQRPGLVIAKEIGQVSPVGCTNDWHNCRSSRMLIVCIPPPIAHVHLAVDSTTLKVSEAHWFINEPRLKWAMCQKEPDTFENIPVV
jgi:hypothetical protein